MLVVLAFAVLVLAGAVVLLFAMLGELTARLPALGVSYRDPSVSALPDARIGARPDEWPLSFGATSTGEQSLVVVLSTACGSCDDVAAQIAEQADGGAASGTAVLVSCPEAEAGREFLERHRLAGLPSFVDEGGAWVAKSFGVRHSPTALVLRSGRLESALVFTDFKAVREAASREEEVAA